MAAFKEAGKVHQRMVVMPGGMFWQRTKMLNFNTGALREIQNSLITGQFIHGIDDHALQAG